MKIKRIENLSEARIEKYKRWQWSHEVLDGCPNYISIPTIAMTTSLRDYYPEMTLIIPYFKEFEMHYHHPEFELEAIVRKTVDKTTKDFNYIEKLYKIWKIKEEKFNKLYKKVKDSNLDGLEDKDLLGFYNDFYTKAIDYIAIPFFIEAFTVGELKLVENNFKDFLERKNKLNKFSDYFSLLTLTEKITFGNRFLLDLLKYSENEKDLQHLLEKYSWIKSNYAHFKKIDESYLKSELKFILKEREEFEKKIENLKNLKTQKKNLIKKLKVPKSLEKQINLMSFLSFWQDERKKMCLKTVELSSIFLDEISKRLDIKKYYLKFAAVNEIEDIFFGKIKLEDLKKRIKDCLFIYDKDKIEVIASSKSKEIFNKILQAPEIKDSEKLSGLPASSGRTKGRVKVLLSSKEEKKMKEGDVLVAGMTRPDYMPAIRKAKAIITDEGGITCHAAIVARELGKPCIIGTKTATKVLKDGDMVEVDANTGIVRKLSK